MPGLEVISDLFSEGTEVVLGRKNGAAVLVWVAKPNPFERQEAIAAAQLARSRLMLALKEIGSPEYSMFSAQITEESDANIRHAIVRSKEQEHYVEAMGDIRTDEEWKPRLDVLDESDPSILTDRDPEDPEVKLLRQIQMDYAEEITRRVKDKDAAMLQDLGALATDRLRERYREVWIETRGAQSFGDAMERTMMYLTLRQCSAKEESDGAWNHTECGHLQRVLASPSEVELLPDGAIKLIRGAMQAVSMEPGRARFSEGQGSSSASSPLPAQPEASTASTPDATSSEPVGTSS